MDYLAIFYDFFSDIFEFLWDRLVQLFEAISPIGITIVLGFTILAVIYRYVIKPLLSR